MSLNGIRNLHSYDHTWSTLKGSGVVPGCSRDAPIPSDPTTWGAVLHGGLDPPGNCPLQAGTSEKAYLLMKNKGFTSEAREEADLRATRVEDNYPDDPSTYFMDNEFHAGKHWIA